MSTACSDRLVPWPMDSAVDVEAVRLDESGTVATALDGSMLHLEAADAHGEHWGRNGGDDALGARRPRSEPWIGLHTWGTSTPNCQRSWFFVADRAERVQHVPLVEHRVGNCPCGVETVGGW